jgi:hypothetical protein
MITIKLLILMKKNFIKDYKMKLILALLALPTIALAEGYYYPVPANPPGYVYALPPAYVVPNTYIGVPQQQYIAPPVSQGQPPAYVPFNTGTVSERPQR